MTCWPNGEYEIRDTGFSSATPALSRGPDGRIWHIPASSSGSPRIWDPADGTWSASLSSFTSLIQMVYAEGLMWRSTNVALIGHDPITAAEVLVHPYPAGVMSGQAVYDGTRLWASAASNLLRGVRLSDGDVLDIPHGSLYTGPLCLGGDGRIYRAGASQVLGIRSDGTLTAYPYPSYAPNGVGSVFWAADRAWAFGDAPDS